MTTILLSPAPMIPDCTKDTLPYLPLGQVMITDREVPRLPTCAFDDRSHGTQTPQPGSLLCVASMDGRGSNAPYLGLDVQQSGQVLLLTSSLLTPTSRLSPSSHSPSSPPSHTSLSP